MQSDQSQTTGGKETVKNLPSETSFLLLLAHLIQIISSRDGDIVASYTKDIGKSIGYSLTSSLTFSDDDVKRTEIDKLKLLCTVIWNKLVNKQIDTLQTNKAGTYLAHDKAFKWIKKINSFDLAAEERYKKHILHFTEGIIQGALECLGLKVETGNEQILNPKKRDTQNKISSRVNSTQTSYVIFHINLVDQKKQVEDSGNNSNSQSIAESEKVMKDAINQL